MRRNVLSAFLVVLISWVPLLWAQDSASAPKEVDSPYQAEMNYHPGDLLELNLIIDGIRWSTFKLDAGDLSDLKSGNTTKIEVTNTLENVGSHTRSLSLVILLEDEKGSMLKRLTLGSIKLSKGKYRSDHQKFKVMDENLMELAKIYIFAETK